MGQKVFRIALGWVGFVAVAACGKGGTPAEPGGPSPGEGTCPAPPLGISVGGSPASRDAQTVPLRRLVLMGGGPEEDSAARLFVEGANGGDVVILRAQGSLTSYPGYFLSTLAPSPRPASVVTVRTDQPAAGGDPAVLCRLSRAEAVWLAGGDQWDYLGGWPAVLHDSLAALASRGRTFGGTSAGSMVLGEAAFDAKLGSVTSAQALADPLRPEVSLSFPRFSQAELRGVLVDTHFSERQREGRLLAFLARFLTAAARDEVVGIGLDEGTALVVEGGRWRAYGPAGKGVWLYRVRGPATLRGGSSLELSGIERAALVPGQEGRWPFPFGEARRTLLRVTGGRVEVVGELPSPSLSGGPPQEDPGEGGAGGTPGPGGSVVVRGGGRQ